jgi:hypothetical protein
MTEAEFNQTVADKKANFITTEQPDFTNLDLQALEKKLQDYVPLLEKLRNRGDSVYGRLYQSSNQSIPSSADTKITLDTKSFSQGVTADTDNSTIGIQSEGYYQVNAVIHYNAPTIGKFYEADLAVNESVAAGAGASRVFASGSSPITIVVSDILYLKPRDTVSLYTYHNTGSGSFTLAGSSYSFLTISRL